MTRTRLLVAVVLLSPFSFGQTTPEVLPEPCEVSLALSAAPKHLQDEASVYVFTADGYVKHREGSNGFTCIVNRDDPHSLKPVCLDVEGARTIVPRIVKVGEWLLEGKAVADIGQRLTAMFTSGELESPARPGVAYMLSEYNRPYSSRSGVLGWFPPHLMFYGPNLTNQDIGFSPASLNSEIHLPFIGYRGPHGFMIVRLAPDNNPATMPLEDCPDWVRGRSGELPAEARQFDFWLGQWDVRLKMRQEDNSWPARVQAVARIYPVLEGKAVLELWDSQAIKGYSLRYFDPALKKWVLWLNWPGRNRSGGSGLEGAFTHGRGEFFSTRTGEDGKEAISRYTFSDITPSSLRWDDAYSSDGGTTWTPNWIMEFSRTADRVQLPPGGADLSTYDDGSRCTLEEFRVFEPLVGSRSGVVRHREPDGGWREVEATLDGYRVLDGCGVLSRIRIEAPDGPVESLQLHSWNTDAGVFEESRLDSRPESRLAVLYGPLDGTSVLLTGRGENPQRRHRWSFEENQVRLKIEAHSAEAWESTGEAIFPSPGSAPRR